MPKRLDPHEGPFLPPPPLPHPTKTNKYTAGNPDHAALEATRGAVSGAIRVLPPPPPPPTTKLTIPQWGTFSLLAGVVAYLSSPIFRNLTVQFKVYLWMCPTVVGSMIEADKYVSTRTRIDGGRGG